MRDRTAWSTAWSRETDTGRYTGADAQSRTTCPCGRQLRGGLSGLRALGSARLWGKWRAGVGAAAGHTLPPPPPDLWVCVPACRRPYAEQIVDVRRRALRRRVILQTSMVEAERYRL